MRCGSLSTSGCWVRKRSAIRFSRTAGDADGAARVACRVGRDSPREAAKKARDENLTQYQLFFPELGTRSLEVEVPVSPLGLKPYVPVPRSRLSCGRHRQQQRTARRSGTPAGRAPLPASHQRAAYTVKALRTLGRPYTLRSPICLGSYQHHAPASARHPPPFLCTPTRDSPPPALHTPLCFQLLLQ